MDAYLIGGGGGSLGSIFWRVRGTALVLFLFYVDVSGMHARSHLSFQPLMIPAPWVLLRIKWSIPGCLPPFLAGNREAD